MPYALGSYILSPVEIWAAGDRIEKWGNPENWPPGSSTVRMYRGTGVSRGVRRTSWERSLKNWELQISCFQEFVDGENVLGLVPASLPHTLGYACTFYASTSPFPRKGWGGSWEECRKNSGCWRECWRGCCSSFLSKESPSRNTLASTPSSAPNFRNSLPSTLPSHFPDFPVSLFCSRPPGSQS